MSSNPWIQHVKSFTKQHGLGYMCAATDPQCSKSYKEKKNPQTVTTPAKTKIRARPMAAVRTLTSPPKIALTPAPAPAPTPAPVKAPTPTVSQAAKPTTNTTKVKATPVFDGKPKYKSRVKTLPPEYANYFHKMDSEHDI